MSNTIRYEFDRGIARIVLNAGTAGNPINMDSAQEFLAAVLQARTDEARVIVVTATGRFFSVGGDLASVAAADNAGALLLELAELAHRAITELVRGEAIVVSAVQGTAAGIGFPIAACADILLAADTAKFSLAYTKVGLSPDGGGSLLVHSLGLHRVLRLALLGDLLSVAEAQAAGLVSKVVPASELNDAVNEVVTQLAAGPRTALASTKLLIRHAAEANLETAMRREAQSISALAASDDGKEGIAAFLDKRSAQFS